MHRNNSTRPAPLTFRIASSRQLQGRFGLTQEELAARAGVSVRQLAHYERSRRLPSVLMTLVRIATVLDTTVDALIAPQAKREIRRLVAAQRSGARLDRPNGRPRGS